MLTAKSRQYLPDSDSPFDLCYEKYLRLRDTELSQRFLSQFSSWDLEEYEQVARSLRGRPVYAADAALHAFSQDCAAVINSRDPFSA